MDSQLLSTFGWIQTPLLFFWRSEYILKTFLYNILAFCDLVMIEQLEIFNKREMSKWSLKAQSILMTKT